MKLGMTLPLVDINGDPARSAIRAGGRGDRLSGHRRAGPCARRQRREPARMDAGPRPSKDFFHDPFVLFGFLAACTGIGDFSTQVMILPQRQTALVAKQAACLDVLSGGRFRFGIGVGWNPVEYVGLNEDSITVATVGGAGGVMQALWAEPHVTFKGEWHTIDDAGINPLPAYRGIPLWSGGHDESPCAALQIGRRLDHARLRPGRGSARRFRPAASHCRGSRPGGLIGIDTRVSAGAGEEAEWRRDVQFWKSCGVTHLTLANYYESGHLHRIAGRTLGDHIAAMRRYWNAVADLL